MTFFRCLLSVPLTVACVLAAFGGGTAWAQAGRARVAEGRVQRPGAAGDPVPVAGQWVVLHRVGSDHASPIDSVRSGTGGLFRFRYTPFGAADALYFVSSMYQGIAYFSPPLHGDVTRGGDADILVYDVTTDTSGLSAQGRHLVIASPRQGKRDVAEVFELLNDGTRTIVARDSIPHWSVHFPAAADSVGVGAGDVSASAVALRSGVAQLFAPLAPGIRQLVLTYKLPDTAFPLSVPVERPVVLLEVLVQEPAAVVEGGGLTEVEAVTIDGNPFRRFLAQNVPASAVVRVTVPAIPRDTGRTIAAVLAAIALVMIAAFVVWMRRSRSRPVFVTPLQTEADRLIAELAALDARFARAPHDRAVYERERAAIKARVAELLATGQSPA